MEFQVDITQPWPDPDLVADVIREIDPTAIADIDGKHALLRVSAAVSATELASLLVSAGVEAEPGKIRQMPSICCGGCSG